MGAAKSNVGGHMATQLLYEETTGKLVTGLLIPETRGRSPMIKPLYDHGKLIGYIGIRNRSFVYRAKNATTWKVVTDAQALEGMQLVAETTPGRKVKTVKRRAKKKA